MDIEDTYEETDADLINSAEDLTTTFRVSESSEFDNELELLEEEPLPTILTNAPAAPQYILPEVIKNFILHFHKHLKDHNTYELHAIYENSFNKFTEKFFKNSPWPPHESIAPLVENDPLFIALYKELYYRHIYSRLTITLKHRLESWQNYTELFNILMNSKVDLPSQWLWEMIDEYIYQFQVFYQYAGKLKKSEEELAILKENPQIFNVTAVLTQLHNLIIKSNIVAFLEREKEKESHDDALTHRLLGYFSIIGLCRVHCLLGDYWLALKSLGPIDITKRGGFFSKVAGCQISLYYYVGFAYLMLRRYVDAIKTFSNILLYISRIKQYRGHQHEPQIAKKNDQMYALLAIAVSLCPQRIDENVHSVLKEKFSDKMNKMQRGDTSIFEDLFVHSCPKFINPAIPLYGSEDLTTVDPQALQLKLFMKEVSQQVHDSQIPTIRSYLKLYTTISTKKLADFLEVNNESFKTFLLCFKHKTHNFVWSGGPPLSGKLSFSSDVDFFIDLDMVHIADTRVTRRYGEFFIRHINKFEEIIKNLERNH